MLAAESGAPPGFAAELAGGIAQALAGPAEERSLALAPEVSSLPLDSGDRPSPVCACPVVAFEAGGVNAEAPDWPAPDGVAAAWLEVDWPLVDWPPVDAAGLLVGPTFQRLSRRASAAAKPVAGDPLAPAVPREVEGASLALAEVDGAFAERLCVSSKPRKSLFP